MKYRLSAACGCDIGKRRGNNEDNFYFDGHYLPAENHALDQILTQDCRLEQAVDFAVFDGMGGQAEGQIASHLAAAVFSSVRRNNSFETDAQKFLRDVTEQMTSTVWHQADESFSNMGTTEAILRFCDDAYYLCNVGDSRIFLFRNGVLKQLSVDHTDEQFLKENGIGRRKPSLTQYIGVSPEELVVEPYVSSGALAIGDQYLICSDGLTDMVSNDGIREILVRNTSPEEKVIDLMQEALQNGGRDNITVILVQIQGADQDDVLQELKESLNDQKSDQKADDREKKPGTEPGKGKESIETPPPALQEDTEPGQGMDPPRPYIMDPPVYTPPWPVEPEDKKKRKRSIPILPVIGTAAVVLVIAGAIFFLLFLRGKIQRAEEQSDAIKELIQQVEVTDSDTPEEITVKSTYDPETGELYSITVYGPDGQEIGFKDYTTDENDNVVLPQQRNKDEQYQTDDDSSESGEDANEDAVPSSEPAEDDSAPKTDWREHSINPLAGTNDGDIIFGQK